jgi:hypothetical protein
MAPPTNASRIKNEEAQVDSRRPSMLDWCWLERSGQGSRVRAPRRITLLGRRAEAWSETIARHNFGFPITCHSGGTIAT